MATVPTLLFDELLFRGEFPSYPSSEIIDQDFTLEVIATSQEASFIKSHPTVKLSRPRVADISPLPTPRTIEDTSFELREIPDNTIKTLTQTSP